MKSHQHPRALAQSILLALASITLGLTTAHADTFGTGPNAFTIDFVNIGNPGNADDAGAGGGSYSSPYGSVNYLYRMGVYEISQDQINKATAGGLTGISAGPHSGNEPTATMQWYEAAAFVNWLNTSQGHQAAYNLSFSGSWSMTLWSSGDAWQLGSENRYRHKDAYYFLPSEDEWYKAAFHKNDGVTANYWDYATGSNTVPAQELTGGTTPFTAVFNGTEPGVPPDVAEVNVAGGLSAYFTMGQNGNVHEWTESATDGNNSTAIENRAFRGGERLDSESSMRSTYRGSYDPTNEFANIGLRVASVPEPSSALLVTGAGLGLLLRRRRKAGL